MGSIVTRLVAFGVAAGAASAARRAAEVGWTLTKGTEPPTADTRDDADLRDLLLWSAVVAGAVFVARRIAASQTKKLLGD